MGLLGLCVSTILLRSHFAIREAVGLSGGVLNLRKQVTDCGLISFGLFSRFFLRTQTRLGKVPLLSSLFLYRGFFSRALGFCYSNSRTPLLTSSALSLVVRCAVFFFCFFCSPSSSEGKKNHKCITITLTTTGWKVFQDPTMTTTYGSCRYVCFSLFLCWCVS